MPDDPNSTIEELEAAYRTGNFSALHRTAARVLTDPQASPEALATARRLDASIGVDVGTLLVLGFALLLFCAIVVRYVL
jgi:hypothetical protein